MLIAIHSSDKMVRERKGGDSFFVCLFASGVWCFGLFLMYFTLLLFRARVVIWIVLGAVLLDSWTLVVGLGR